MSTFDSTFDATFTGSVLLEPADLTQSQTITSPSFSGASVVYNLQPNDLTQGQVLTEPDFDFVFTLNPRNLTQGQSISSPSFISSVKLGSVTVTVSEQYTITTTVSPKL